MNSGLLIDPNSLHYIKYFAEQVFSALTGYCLTDIIDKLKSGKEEKKSIYIGSIYAEVVNIVDRIDASGHINKIEIGSPMISPTKKLTFEQKHKDYLREIRKEIILGNEQEIIGDVFKLYPNIHMVEVRKKNGKKCKMFLDKEDFDAIRYSQRERLIVKFTGRPRFFLGVDNRNITDFEVNRIEFTEAS